MKNITEKDITELGKLWQEEIMNLSEITPESLDALENRIQDILHRLGKSMMEWKLLRGIPPRPQINRKVSVCIVRLLNALKADCIHLQLPVRSRN